MHNYLLNHGLDAGRLLAVKGDAEKTVAIKRQASDTGCPRLPVDPC